MDVAGPLGWSAGLRTLAVASVDGCTLQHLSGARSRLDECRFPPPQVPKRRRSASRRLCGELIHPDAEILIKKIDSHLARKTWSRRHSLCWMQAGPPRGGGGAGVPGPGSHCHRWAWCNVRGVPLRETNFARDALFRCRRSSRCTGSSSARRPKHTWRALGAGAALAIPDDSRRHIFLARTAPATKTCGSSCAGVRGAAAGKRFSWVRQGLPKHSPMSASNRPGVRFPPPACRWPSCCSWSGRARSRARSRLWL